MKRYLGISFAAFCGAVLFAGIASAKSDHAPKEFTNIVNESDIIGDVDGTQPAPSKVLQDTVWIADWSFDNGASCTTTGWVKFDNRVLFDGSNYWSVDNRFNGLGADSVRVTGYINGKAAILSRHNLCWVRDGYGNEWDYSIILKYSGATAMLEFDKSSDSEAGYDYVTVETDSLGLSEVLANICANPTATPAALRTEVLTGQSGQDGGSHVGPLALTNFGAGTHEAYIRFTADGGYSDEDGNWPTANNAGLIVDNIVVTGGLAYSENFEGALNANVALVNTAGNQPFCAAPWVRIFSHITDNDKCTENVTCAWLGTDPLRIAFFPDMAFGPGQAVIHNWLDDHFVSPWVSLASTPSATGTILSFRRFPGNPFGNGDIVQGWRVRAKSRRDNTDTAAPLDSIDCVGNWGHANQFNSLGAFQWLTSLFDMTVNFTPTAKEIQVSFRNSDFQLPTLANSLPPTTLNPGPGPYVDRIRIGRKVLTGPSIDVGIDTRTQAEDAFPTVRNLIPNGEHYSPDPAPAGAGRFGSCAFSEGTDLAINNTTSNFVSGDSIYLQNVVDARGGHGVNSVKFYGAIIAGPHAGKAPAPYTVAGNGFFSIAADSARNSLGNVVANRWFVDMDDTYFRGGDQMDYFWVATDTDGGFTSSPSGMTALPLNLAAAELATLGLREVNYLPTINWSPAYLARIAADANGDLDPTAPEIAASTQKNCILYFQKLNSNRRSGRINRTSFMYTLEAMGYAGSYDVFDVQGYGNTNNVLGSRAVVGQCSGYAVIIQDDGRSTLVPNMPDGIIWDDNKINQAQWYRDYLAQGSTGLIGTATVLLDGENTAFQKASNPLFTTDMGLTTIVTDQALSVNPDVEGGAAFTWANGGVTSFVGDKFSLNGGCPAIRAYDGAGATGTAVVTHRYKSGATTGTGAIIMNKNSVLKWNTVWMGFGWLDIRDAFGGAPGSAEKGLLTKIFSQALPVNCIKTPNVTGPGTEPEIEAPAVTKLAQNVPNPFNPTTKISFDLAHNGHVKLAVYDVAGHLVKTLVNGPMQAKRNIEVTWNGLDEKGLRAPSGVYFYQLVTDELTATKKMALLK